MSASTPSLLDISEGQDTKRPEAKVKNFLYLPREIRDNIYDLSMADLCDELVISKDMQPSPLTPYSYTLPAICFVHTQLREEAILAYIRRTHLVVADGPSQKHLYSFLSSLPDAVGFKAVRSLAFSSFFWYGPAYPKKLDSTYCWPSYLTSKCTGLRRLSIRISVLRMLDMTFQLPIKDVSYVIKQGEAVDSEINLARVFEHKSLQHLEILFTDGQLYSSILKCREQCLTQNFVDFLCERNEHAGGKVKIESTFLDTTK